MWSFWKWVKKAGAASNSLEDTSGRAAGLNTGSENTVEVLKLNLRMTGDPWLV